MELEKIIPNNLQGTRPIGWKTLAKHLSSSIWCSEILLEFRQSLQVPVSSNYYNLHWKMELVKIIPNNL